MKLPNFFDKNLALAMKDHVLEVKRYKRASGQARQEKNSKNIGNQRSPACLHDRGALDKAGRRLQASPEPASKKAERGGL